MLAPDSIHEFIEAPANLGGGTQFLLKLYWRLELAVGIAHFPIIPFCMGEAGRCSVGFAVDTVPLVGQYTHLKKRSIFRVGAAQ
jgi:hypothetical protein